MKILGIDPGTYSVKILEIETSFRGYQIVDSYEFPLGADPNLEEQALVEIQSAIVARFIREHRIDTSKNVWCLPQSLGTLRTFQFPFKDKKKIHSNIPFQLEDAIPYDLDEVLNDTLIFPSQEGADVSCAIAPITHLQDELTRIQSGGCDPQILTFPVSTYRSLMQRVLSDSLNEKRIVLADLGHQKSQFFFYDQGIPKNIQVSPYGGYEITFELSKFYQISLPDAERIKHQNAFIISQQSDHSSCTKEQIEFSNSIKVSLKNLIRDLKHFMVSNRARSTGPIDALYVCGGTSLIKGLVSYLTDELKIPTLALHPLSHLSSKVHVNENQEAVIACSLGTALTQIPKEPIGTFNFRKGPLARRSKTEFNLTDAALPLSKALLLLFVIQLTFGILGLARSYRLDRLKKTLNSSLRTHELALSDTPLKAIERRQLLEKPALIETKVQKRMLKKKKQISILRDKDHLPSKQLIELSEAIPKTIEMDLVNYNSDGSSINLTARLYDQTQTRILKDLLSQDNHFTLEDYKLSVSKTEDGAKAPSYWTAQIKLAPKQF